MDREAWCATIHEIAKSWTWLSNWTELKLCFHLENIYVPFLHLYVLVTQFCPALCDPMDCSLPDSSVHGILQARILEWIAMPFSRGSSWPWPWSKPGSLAFQADSLLSEPPSKPFLGVMKDKSEQHYLARYPCVLFSSWQKLEEKLCQKLAVMEFI